MKDYNDQIATRIEAVMMTMRNASSRNRPRHKQQLRPTMFLIMNILAEHFTDANAAPITVSELAKQTHVSPAATTQTLDILERKKMIERVKSKADRRVTFVVLTRKGRSMLRNYSRLNSHNRRSNMMKELLEYLGDEDSAELARLMEKISEFINEKYASGDEIEEVK